MKKIAIYVLGFLLLITAIFLIGPRPSTDETIHFRADSLSKDIDAYLVTNEKKITNITPGAEKEIIWADPATKAKTPLAIIYLHGFSATKMEVRPVPDNVAKSFGANLYFIRLTGHGVGGFGLGEATMNDWLNDLAEAIAIGEQLGEKIIFVTTSTGGTLAVFGTKFPQLMKKVSGMVLLSPNFALHSASNDLMNIPWAETLLPIVVGNEISWEPKNEQHRKWWTSKYPMQAIFTMAALMRQVEAIDKSKITLPALFIYSKDDQTVRPSITDEVVKNWGGPVEVLIVETPEEASNHVITGDILNPTATTMVSERIIEWIEKTR
ncbi:MAG: alpha/beta hydrolase [Rhizobiaceae bacterium]|nr:alpha/beta hydrolase [Rhizobiaceae bacterium]